MSTTRTEIGFHGNLARLFLLFGGLALLSALALNPGFLNRALPTTPIYLPKAPMYEIALDGRVLHVDRETASQVAEHTALRAARGRSEAEASVHTLVGSELDGLFRGIRERIPAYADWYFSMPGEYARLSMLLLGRLGMTEADYVSQKAIDILLDGGDLAAPVAAIEKRTEALLTAQAGQLRAAWLGELLALVDGSGRDVAAGAPEAVLRLDGLAAEFGGHGASEFLTRVSFSSASAAGSAALAPLLAKLALRPAGAAIAVNRAAAKTAGRGLARAGAVGGSSVLGCAAAGPAALGCAALVGGFAWVATDWALLGIDEWRYRDQLIADWEARLDEIRADLEVGLLEHYEGAIGSWHEALNREVERSFSPLHGSRRPDRDAGA